MGNLKAHRKYERIQDRDTLLQSLASGTEDIVKGRVYPLKELFKKLYKLRKKTKKNELRNNTQ